MLIIIIIIIIIIYSAFNAPYVGKAGIGCNAISNELSRKTRKSQLAGEGAKYKCRVLGLVVAVSELFFADKQNPTN